MSRAVLETPSARDPKPKIEVEMNAIILRCERVRKGNPFSEQIRVSYSDDFPAPLPTLTIESDYKPTLDVYRCTETYSVSEFPCSGDFDGRGFRLVKQSTGDTRDVFLHRNGQDMLCDCEGFVRYGYCKHCDAMRHVIKVNLIDDPHEYNFDDLPVWPLPEGEDPFTDDVPANKTQAI